MYENPWQVPGKLLSADAEGAAVLGLRTHRYTTSTHANAGSQAPGGEARS
jgi:hypothetical protein